MIPADTDQKDQLTDDNGGTAPDSETQSSAASAQGSHNNPELRQELTGGTTTNDTAEGPREEDM